MHNFAGQVLVFEAARAPAGPLPWFPRATARWRSWRSWECAGGPARSSRGAACGASGPCAEARDGHGQRGHRRAEGPAPAGRHGGGVGGPPRRGRGRVRQGVCPFHDEAEGSFTVYGDSERFYCFGCGAGGDVLDFIGRVERLSLPEAIARLDGSPGPPPRAANRPAGARRRFSFCG